MFSLGILFFKLNGHVFKFERRMRFKNSKCAEQENARLKNAISCLKLFTVRLIVPVCNLSETDYKNPVSGCMV